MTADIDYAEAYLVSAERAGVTTISSFDQTIDESQSSLVSSPDTVNEISSL